jgi:hypothetical protein
LNSKKSENDDDAKRTAIINGIVSEYVTQGLFNMYLSGEHYTKFCKEKDGKSTSDSKCFTYPEANDDSSSLGNGLKALVDNTPENKLRKIFLDDKGQLIPLIHAVYPEIEINRDCFKKTDDEYKDVVLKKYPNAQDCKQIDASKN